MDSITQIALGATVAEAGFTRRLGPKALAVGALTALLPDLDLFANLFGDEWTVLRHHRGITHSLVVTPFVAALIGWLGWHWSRRGRAPAADASSPDSGPDKRPDEKPDERPDASREGGTSNARGMWPWIHLAFWAHVTHVLLDWCTSYGTMLLYPLSFRRFANDAVAIIDPIYSVPLFAGLAAAVVLRRRGRAGWRWAAGTLAVTTLYLVFGWALTQRSVAFARGELARQGFEAVKLRATPMLPVFLLRRICARDGGGNVCAGAMSPFSSRPIAFTRFDRSDDPLVEKALASEGGRIFEWFADGMLAARVERAGGATTVHLGACHYGFVSDPEFTPFGARFTFDEAGELVEATRSRHVELSISKELAAEWRLLVGSPPPPARATGGARPDENAPAP